MRKKGGGEGGEKGEGRGRTGEREEVRGRENDGGSGEMARVFVT